MQASHSNLKSRIPAVLIVIVCGLGAFTRAKAQDFDPADVAGYRYVERTIFVKQPVTRERWVEETQMETQLVKESHPVYETEKRERRRVVQKPVTRTTMKEERTVVQKPVTETRYREREVEETSYDYVTEMRDEEYTVRKPVIETQYRDEQFTVRQKVTEDLIEVKNQTVLKPQTTNQTVYYPSQLTTQYTDLTSRPRLQWLNRGYYTDPASGQSVWRRSGLHWVQPNLVATTPMLTPTTVEQTVLVPETIQTRRPVEISRYEDRLESRRVPYEVERMVTETEVRRVPVTVKKPVVKRSVERVPYTETRYVDVEEIRQVPIEETVYEEVVEFEPYEVEVKRWKDITREVEVPRTVRRKVEYQEMQEVAKVVLVKVPVDKQGRDLSMGEPVSDEEMRSRYSSGYGSTAGSSRQIAGQWESSKSETSATTDNQPKSVLMQETSDPKPALQPIQGQDDQDEDGEKADQRPSLGNENRQNDQAIQNLTVRRQPSLDLDVRPAPQPGLNPNHQADVLEGER